MLALLGCTLAVISAPLAHASPISTNFVSQATNRGSNSRAGWYGDQPALSPKTVASNRFGQLFDTHIVGQVYAQPLVASGVLIVATEQNWIYGLNPSTGAIEWSRQIAQPFYNVQAWTYGGLVCTDLTPYVGVTSTPTVDPTTGIVYLMNMEQDVSGAPSYWMQAINPLTGASEPNFPVEVSGTAQNDPSLSFNAMEEIQRPGLLLLNGRVYAAFGSHCDDGQWHGFVVGVNTTGSISTIWTDVTGHNKGGGIWQSGGGLVQYGNDIVLTSGNGDNSPVGPLPGTSPPASLGESVVELSVSPTGTLTPVDFFSPYNTAFLDANDLDFGSGAPVVLPSSFGTRIDPHVILQESKEGYVYLLNAAALGGVSNGPNGGDDTLATVGPYGGVWATPAVYPTPTGGYVYIPTATGGTGSLGNAGQGNFDVYRESSLGATPTLQEVATAGNAKTGSTPFGFGTSSPVVTSNQMKPGTGVVWTIRNADGQGDDATLQAYNATPHGRWLTLLNQWPVGVANKFTSPGVWGNKIYVPTKNGQLFGFGIRHAPTLSGPSVNFSATIVGTTSLVKTVRVTAHQALTITGVTIPTNANSGAGAVTAQFKLRSISPRISTSGLHLRAGQSEKISLEFTPRGSPGAVLGVLQVNYTTGELQLPLTGLAQSPKAVLYGSTTSLNFEGVTVATTSTLRMTFTNFGHRPLIWGPTTLPSNGFTISNVPVSGTQLDPMRSITLLVSYSPGSATAETNSTFSLSTADTKHPTIWPVALSAFGAEPANLVLRTSSGGPSVDFAPTQVGATSLASFTIDNIGGSTATISNSLPPSSPMYQFEESIPSGDQIGAGQSLTVNAIFQPSSAGNNTSTWQLETNSPNQSTFNINFQSVATGSGYALGAVSSTSGWSANGSCQLSTNEI
ncbi:MAG: choice-of-anchor D domain-containing protein, partial [Acidimicrobiales bacterium]